MVALKGMYLQAAALPRFYREGKLEAFSWIVTFIAVVLVDVDVGYDKLRDKSHLKHRPLIIPFSDSFWVFVYR